MSLLRLSLASGLVAGLAGCSSGDDYVPPEPPPASSAPAQAGEQEEATVEDRVAAMMETNERAVPDAEMRDPFMQPRPRRGPDGLRPIRDLPRPDCDTEAEPLGKIELEDLDVMGLITGTALPRAMFTVPGDAQAIIVAEGALAGPDCSNRLVDIRDNEVVFEQITMNEDERSVTTLQLNENRIGARLVRIETE